MYIQNKTEGQYAPCASFKSRKERGGRDKTKQQESKRGKKSGEKIKKRKKGERALSGPGKSD